jgi:putative intracellular protease/amidase
MEKSSLTPTLLVLGVICAIFAGCATTDEATAEEPETKRVLLLMRHGNESMHSLYGVDTDDVLTNEVGVMRTMLQEAGLEVVVAAAGREPLEGTTQVLQPDTIFQVVRLRDYHGVIIPCLCLGSLSTRWHALGDEITLVRHAVAAGLPVAAQKGAIIILAEAGVLEGREYAFVSDPEATNRAFQGAFYSGPGVVQDGNIITSSYCATEASRGHENGTPEMTRLFIVAVKAIGK